MPCGADTEANDLITSLTDGMGFTIPSVDLDDEIYKLPADVTSAMYAALEPLTNDALTTGDISGSGTFDALMRGFKSHLAQEFEKGRITGAEYAKAYTTLTQNAMASGVQFLLGRDQAFWAAQLAQLQAITARVQLDAARVELARIQLEALNAQGTYALTKMKLAESSIQYCTTKYNLDNILPAQKAQIERQTLNMVTEDNINKYQLSDILPTQKAQTLQQTSNLLSEKANIEQRTTNAVQERLNLIAESGRISQQTTNMVQERLNLIAEAERIDQQTTNLSTENSIATYNLSNILPKNLAILTAQVSQAAKDLEISTYNLSTTMPAQKLILDKQAADIEAGTDLKVFELEETAPKNIEILEADRLTKMYNYQDIMPLQKNILFKEGDIKDAELTSKENEALISTYNLENILPTQKSKLLAEVSLTTMQANAATYTWQSLMPKQLELLGEQVNTQRAQTGNNRSDGSALSGVLGKQIELYNQQIISYQRDAQVKAAKMFTDAWITQKTIDEGTLPPNGFTNASIDTVLSAIKAANNF